MKRYRLIYRGCRDAYYCLDTHTHKRESLGINDAGEAQRLVDARNEAVRHVSMNLQIAQVYLQHSDPTLATRTWQNVMDAMGPLKTGPTQSRWISAMRDKAFDLIRDRKLIETTSEHFVQVLTAGTISTNMFCAAFTTTRPGCTGFRGPSCQSAFSPLCITRNAGQSRLKNTSRLLSAKAIPKSERIINSCGTWAAPKRTSRN